MGKLDELKEKLNNSVQELLAKTPFGKKNKDEDDDENETTGEFTSRDLDELQDEDKTELTEASLDVNKGNKGLKNKFSKQFLIRGGLVVLIVALGADQFLSSGDTENKSAKKTVEKTPETKSAKRRRKRKSKKAKLAKAKSENIEKSEPEKQLGLADEDSSNSAAKKETNKTETLSNMAESLAADNPLKLNPPDVNINEAAGIPPETPSKVLDMANTENDSKTNDIAAEEIPIEEPTVIKNETVEVPTPKLKEVEVPKAELNAVEVPIDKEMNSTSSPTDKMGQNSINTEKENEQQQNEIDQQSKSIEDKMMDSVKAAEKKEYITPPNYENLGRGLVYNCTDKHWSCINKKSFFKCRDNFAWSKANQKPVECAVKNVYANVRDCEKVQQYYIDNLMTMDSCSK